VRGKSRRKSNTPRTMCYIIDILLCILNCNTATHEDSTNAMYVFNSVQFNSFLKTKTTKNQHKTKQNKMHKQKDMRITGVLGRVSFSFCFSICKMILDKGLQWRHLYWRHNPEKCVCLYYVYIMSYMREMGLLVYCWDVMRRHVQIIVFMSVCMDLLYSCQQPNYMTRIVDIVKMKWIIF